MTVAPPPGVSSIVIVGVHGVDEASGDGEPEAEPFVGIRSAVAEALEGLEHGLALVAGDADTTVDHPDVDAVADGARLRPGRWCLRVPS